MSRNENGDQQHSSQSVKQFGVTPAVSLAEPSLEDLQRNEQLINLLKSYGVTSNIWNMNVVDTIGNIKNHFSEWTVAFMVENFFLRESEARVHMGTTISFASYSLGHHKDGDIEILCVSCYIQRDEFFSSFLGVLKQQKEITECRAIKEAFVPAIKFKMDGFELHLVFVECGLKLQPIHFNLNDDNLLKDLDSYSLRSVHGFRVTEQMFSLVPDINNFSLTLSTIKLWAKKNGIYSTSLGYFGGMTLAILVARTCQLYPNATIATLVNKFFLLFSKWNWPDPVLLKHPDNDILNLPIWNPSVYISDRNHLMPIITPAYPQQNSTFNITESTKKIIMSKLNCGLNLTNDIMTGLVKWERLFETPSFFFRYRYFLVLIVNSQSPMNHVSWCDFIESKLRFLATLLEEKSEITMVHANPKCFEHKKNNIILTTSGLRKDIIDVRSSITESPYSSMWFLALDINSGKQSPNLDITDKVQQFYDLVYKEGEKHEIIKKGMNIEARHVKRKHLCQYFNAEFLESERKSMEMELNDCKRIATS